MGRLRGQEAARSGARGCVADLLGCLRGLRRLKRLLGCLGRKERLLRGVGLLRRGHRHGWLGRCLRTRRVQGGG